MFLTAPIHHRIAKRWVRTAQVAMLVGAVGVVPVLLFAMPDGSARPVTDFKPIEPPPPPIDKSAKPIGVDFSGVGARFELVSNTPKPKAVVEDAPDHAVALPPPPAVKYLGAIIEPAARAALLVIEGKQRMLWVGDKAGNIELVSVEREHITVKEHGVERQIDLAPRTGPVVSMANGAPMSAPGMNPTPDPSGGDSGEQHEMRAREIMDRVRNRDGRPPR